jgi:hypothetical protein
MHGDDLDVTKVDAVGNAFHRALNALTRDTSNLLPYLLVTAAVVSAIITLIAAATQT